MAKADELMAICTPVVTGMGYELWGIEYLSQGKNSVLRIYIDHEDGVTVDDCADVSAQIASVLDVEDPIGTAYTLEISSPGMDRPLFNIEQCRQQVGQWVRLKLRVPVDGKRKVKGQLMGVEDDSLVVRSGEYEYVLPYEQVEKANIMPVFEKNTGRNR